MGSKFSDLFSRSEYENILKLENEAFNGKYIVNQLVRIPFINNSNLSVSIRPIANNRGNIKEIIATLTIISWVVWTQSNLYDKFQLLAFYTKLFREKY